MAAASNVNVATGAYFNLGFSGTDMISQLWLGGAQMAAGTYDALNSLGFLTGSGSLLVTNGPIVPEPGTIALLATAGLAAAALRRRIRR